MMYHLDKKMYILQKSIVHLKMGISNSEFILNLLYIFCCSTAQSWSSHFNHRFCSCFYYFLSPYWLLSEAIYSLLGSTACWETYVLLCLLSCHHLSISNTDIIFPGHLPILSIWCLLLGVSTMSFLSCGGETVSLTLNPQPGGLGYPSVIFTFDLSYIADPTSSNCYCWQSSQDHLTTQAPSLQPSCTKCELNPCKEKWS